VRKLRAARPDLSLSSDFIVGFPGETEADFEATMKLIDDVGFDASFSFIYSARPGTPAPTWPTTRRRNVKLARLMRLQKRIDEQAQAISAAMVGSVQRMLVEGVSKKDAQASWPGAPTTTASSTSPAIRAAGSGASSTCHHAALPHSLRGEIVTKRANPHERQDAAKSSRAIELAALPSTTSASPTCAARSTRTCARSRPPRRGHRPPRRALHAARRAPRPDGARGALQHFYAQGQGASVGRRNPARPDRAGSTGRCTTIAGGGVSLHAQERAARPHAAAGGVPAQIQEHDITFGIGPAGTGKTYLAVASAVDAFERDQVSASCSPARRSRPASASASCPATWRRRSIPTCGRSTTRSTT
jgi:hypothetical protein